MTRSPKPCSAGTTAPTESTTGDADGRTTQTTTCRSDEEVPEGVFYLFDALKKALERKP